MPMRSKLIMSALVASLALNAATVFLMGAWMVRKGGPRYLMEQVGLVRTVKRPAPYHVNLARRYEELPNTEGEIVFLGDSITEFVPWSEYFSDIRNRGISSDTTDGVLQRLGEVIKGRPKQVFLNIGTNDLSMDITIGEMLENVEAMIGRIGAESPATEVYLCSVLPINLDLERNVRLERKFKDIGEYDEGLKELAERRGVNYIDLRPWFTDSRGYLRSEFTADGIHLNDAGNAAYSKALCRYVKSVFSSLPTSMSECASGEARSSGGE